MRWIFAGYFVAAYAGLALWLLGSAGEIRDWAATLAFCGAVVPLLLDGLLAQSYLTVSPATSDRIARGLREGKFSRTYAFAVGVGAGILGMGSAALVVMGVCGLSESHCLWISFVAAPLLVCLMPLVGTWWLAKRGR